MNWWYGKFHFALYGKSYQIKLTSLLFFWKRSPLLVKLVPLAYRIAMEYLGDRWVASTIRILGLTIRRLETQHRRIELVRKPFELFYRDSRSSLIRKTSIKNFNKRLYWLIMNDKWQMIRQMNWIMWKRRSHFRENSKGEKNNLVENLIN